MNLESVLELILDTLLNVSRDRHDHRVKMADRGSQTSESWYYLSSELYQFVSISRNIDSPGE